MANESNKGSMVQLYEGIYTDFMNEVLDRNGREAIILGLITAMEKITGDLTPKQSEEIRRRILSVMSEPASS